MRRALLLHGRGEARHCKAAPRITPRVNRWPRTTAVSATPRPTGTPRPCPQATCPILRTRPAVSVTRRRPRTYDARRQFRTAYRHQQRLRPVPRRHIRAHVVQQFHTEDAVLAPSHIPYLAGTDCGSCHKSSTYAVGSFGPMNMTQATHAFAMPRRARRATGGLELLHGRGESGAAGPAGRSHIGSNGGADDCSICHTTANWNSTMCLGPYAESGQSGLHHLPHRSARELHDARRECGPAYRHHEQPMCSVPWRYDAAHLVQQLHAEGRGAHALAHSFSCRHELRLLPLLEHLCGRRFRTDEHDAGDSCVRGDHLRHVPREGPEPLHGRGDSRAAGPAGRSHLRSNGGAQRLQHLPHDGELEQHDIARGTHAEPRQSDLHRLSHRRAVQLRDACGQRRSSHRHHLGLHYLSRCAERGCAGLLSQLHAEGRDSFTRAHPDRHHAVRELPRGQFHDIQRHDDECVQAHHDAVGDRRDLRSVPRPFDVEILRRRQLDHAAERTSRRQGLQRLP